MDLDLLLDLANVDVGNVGVVAVDDLGKLLESGTLGLDVHEEDEGELESDPALLSKLLAYCISCIAAKQEMRNLRCK